MLPGELQQKYANDPAYQAYLKWQQDTGGRWAWWTGDAAAAAQAAGIPQSLDTTGWRSWQTDWGEGKMDNPATPEPEDSATNPAWTQFVNQYMQQHPGGAPYNQGGGDPAVIPPDIRAQLDAQQMRAPGLTSIPGLSSYRAADAGVQANPAAALFQAVGQAGPQMKQRRLAAPAARLGSGYAKYAAAGSKQLAA